MEQPKEHRKVLVPFPEFQGTEKVDEGPEELLAVLEAEEEAEALEEIRDVRTRLELTSSATNVPTASITASCSMTKWHCQASTASLAATAETVGGLRRGAT